MADGADPRDADLVVDVRAGNAESFAVLFDRWFGPVLGAAQSLVGEQAEAARVATDTFQSVWLHLDELADPAEFGAWVLLTSRTFARQRQAQLDPSAAAPSGPLFDNEDELRRAVAKVLVRRDVPALVLTPPAAPSPITLAAPAPAAPAPAAPAWSEPEPAPAGSDPASDRLHRYHWTPTEPSVGLADRVRSFRLSPGTLVALAIVLLGSVIWLMSRDDSSQIDGGRSVPLFAPSAPTTIDGAAARSNNGGGGGAAAAPAVAPGTVPPDPAAPPPTVTAAADGSRKVKVATVVPRAVTTAPVKRGTTAAPSRATVTTVATAPAAPRAESQPSATVTVAPSSSATTTSTTARTTTTAESTTASTARTTTTTGRTTTTAESTTTTARASTTTTARASTTTTARASTTTTVRASTTTTAASVSTASTARTTTTTRPTTTTAAPATTRATTVVTTIAPTVSLPTN